MTQLLLKKTCSACPEQYDVFLGEEQIGYFQLKHGLFNAKYPNSMGSSVYSCYTRVDRSLKEEERDKILTEACKAILVKHFRQEHNPLYRIEE